jgi:uncharacterized protein YegL
MHEEKLNEKDNYKKVIFLLTDGETELRNECITIAKLKRKSDTIINTFGIGNDCDQRFVEQIAEEGEGACVLLQTNEVNQLRSKVIEILSKTIQPSLKNFSSKFTCMLPKGQDVVPYLRAYSVKRTNEIYRN